MLASVGPAKPASSFQEFKFVDISGHRARILVDGHRQGASEFHGADGDGQGQAAGRIIG
jgi:hypothetical protein